MSERTERAARLQSLLSQPGWFDVLAMADEQAGEQEESILDLMTSNPDKLTGKTAIAKANQAKGVRLLIQSIKDEAKISPQP